MCGKECLRFVSTGDVIVEEAPWGSQEWFVQAPLTESEHLMMVKVTIPPGQAHRFHYHPHFEEAIYFLSGSGEQWVGETCRETTPGSVAHVPAGVVHGTYNTGEEPLVLLVALASAQFLEPMVVDCCEDAPWRDLKDPTLQDYR